MDDDQRRNPELTTAILFLGLVLLFSLCVGAVMLITAFYPHPAPTPTLDLFPKLAPIPSSTPELVLVVPATFTPTATSTATLMVITPTNDGNSCRYGPPWINAVATGIPDGGQSAQQDYKCVNGYWYLGVGDWVDARTGDWGSDGIQEQAYVKYNADGTVMDRKFLNLQGTQVPGPKK